MILVTGCAGFIGFHLTKKLLLGNKKVIGIYEFNNFKIIIITVIIYKVQTNYQKNINKNHLLG